MKRLRTHDEYLQEVLKDPKEAALFLNAAAEENDPALLMEALAKVARAHGMSRMSQRTSLTRMGLYKTLSVKGNPEFRTFLKLVAASGLQLLFKPKEALAA